MGEMLGLAITVLIVGGAALGIGAPADPRLLRWVALAGLALAAIYLVRAVVGCVFRLVGLAVLLFLAWLAWSRLS